MYTAGHGCGIFCFGGINQVFCVTGIFYRFCCVTGIFYRFCETLSALVWGYGGILWFNPNMQNTALWLTLALPNPDTGSHFDYILAINASLLLCEEPSADTILSAVKYSISPLNSSNVFPIIVCCFYCVHKCKTFIVEKLMQIIKHLRKSSFTHINYEMKISYMCADQHYNIWFCVAEVRKFIFYM